jgi:hypothetical protein
LQQIGTDAYGRPVYGYPMAQPVAPQQPLVARPWGAYIALGLVGSIVATFFLIGLARAAMAVALSAVALTICVVVLRDVWRSAQRREEDS